MITTNKPTVIVIIGPPGAGKSSLVQPMIKKFGGEEKVLHLEASSCLRGFARYCTDEVLLQQITDSMSNGSVVPGPETARIIACAISEKLGNESVIIISGMRGEGSVEQLNKEYPLKAVICNTAHVKELKKRIAKQGDRTDSADKVVMRRIQNGLVSAHKLVAKSKMLGIPTCVVDSTHMSEDKVFKTTWSWLRTLDLEI